MAKVQTVGAICAGVSGLEMAAGLALGPIETAWHAEVDPDASSVLDARYPGVPNHGDITAIDWRKVEPVELLCAGFPCTTVSCAGQRRGDADKRWLWEYVADAVRITRPATVVIENVANLVSIQGGRLFRAVLDDLRAAGYAVRWAIAGACTAGGCHHRHRVFILARRVGRTAPPAIRVDMPTCNDRGAAMLPTPRASDTGTPGRRASEGFRPPLSQVILSLPLLPTPRASDGGGGPRKLPARRTHDGPDRGPCLRDVAAVPEQWGKYAPAVARWATTYGVLPPDPTEPDSKGGRRLAAAFPEWMMGYPSGWVTDLVGRNAALRLTGNGVMPQQGGRVLGLLAADEEAPTDLLGVLAAVQ